LRKDYFYTKSVARIGFVASRHRKTKSPDKHNTPTNLTISPIKMIRIYNSFIAPITLNLAPIAAETNKSPIAAGS